MSLQTELNRADPNRLADLLRTANIGDVLARLAADVAVEETVTVTTNVGTLASRALAILAISATAGGTTGLITPQSATVAAVTKGCQVGVDRKTLTFFATDAVTTAKVTYIKAPAGLETALAALFAGQ